VIFQGERYWVAQCLEIDIATQGSDFDQLAERFERALQAHIEISRERDADPFTCLPPAPDRHWDKWPDVVQAGIPPEDLSLAPPDDLDD
jgi:hypothetical protein